MDTVPNPNKNHTHLEQLLDFVLAFVLLALFFDCKPSSPRAEGMPTTFFSKVIVEPYFSVKDQDATILLFPSVPDS